MVKMRVNAEIFIIICVLFLVGTAGASDTSNISISKDWVIANGVDQSTITVNVQNTSGPINGATVSFMVNNPVYGTMSPATVTTGPSGLVASTFTVNKKSGTAIITATINYNDGGTSVTATKTVSQNIDHDILSPTFTPATGIVGQEIPFNLSITDQWGNPIDNRRSDDTVSLSVSCPMPNDCVFVGYGHSFSSRPDLNGNLMLPLQLGTKTGLTTIVMSPVQDLSQQVFMIDTMAGDPILTADVSPAAVPPSLPTVPVNTGVFDFSYTLSDKFGNPIANQPILIQTSLDENLLTKTNAFGQTPVQRYGPKSSVSTVDITATVVNSTPSITNQFTVAFTTAEPKDMTLIVTPQAMGSRDYDPASKADVVVRVLDNFGNPVSGEDITLTLGSPSYAAGSAIEDIHPYLNSPGLTSYSGKTDDTGKVTAVFVPGNFTSTESSEGSCILTATWASKPSYSPKSATLTWTNRPYLNVAVSVNPTTVKVNETIDVTIEISGNGKTGKYRPITLVIDEDTSASMKNPSDGGISRVVRAANAAEGFLNSLDASNTRVGLEIFGYEQSIGHMPIPSDFSLLINNYKNLVCQGNSQGMEDSIRTSYNKIIVATTPGGTHENDVKALIILSDGGSNLANNALDDLISTAKDNRIHVFVIAYLNNPGSATAEANFVRLTQETGGKYYASDNSAEIAGFYVDIEKLIKQLADEDTKMTVSFEKITINGTEYAGSDVYDYIPVGPFSPLQTTINTGGRTSIIWPNGTQTVKDQSPEWPNLQFNVGAIDIGQTWSTTFRIRVKQNGTYNVFGAGTQILLNGKIMSLPDLPITVQSDLPEKTGFITGTLNVMNLQTVSSGPFTAFIPLQWDTKYDSPTLTNVATETVSYRSQGSTFWKQFDVKSAPVGDTFGQTTLDVRNLPSGSYEIRVHAHAVDADDAYSGIITVVVAHGSTSTYIKLK
ncbi:MAG: hypothetical protein Q7V05_06065 [Methanoregula sp.]|nr:hypothetical protein [Methanoregula sp.]